MESPTARSGVTLTQELASWVSELKFDDLPTDVLGAIRRCLIDFSACVLGGSQSIMGAIAGRSGMAWGGTPESSVAGSPARVAAQNAAWVNSTLANALDFDDTLHGHPGATTFPVALALGEREDASGEDFVAAVAAGYEIAVRSLVSMQPMVPRFEGQWDLGTLQTYGAAAAAGRILRFSGRDIETLFGLASATAPVPLPRKERELQGPRSMVKSAYGWASMAAVMAADLVAAGFSGPNAAFDGTMGFWRMLEDDSGGSRLTDNLGEDWAVLKAEFKPFMACRFLHPAIQAFQEILDSEHPQDEEIKSISVHSYRMLGDEYHFRSRPESVIDAQFSLPYLLATMAVFGELGLGSYEQETLSNERILSLADRVEFVIDDEYDSAFPDKYGARVAVKMGSGYKVSRGVDHPHGSADSPLSDSELVRKFRKLAQPVLSQENASSLLSLIKALPSTRVRDLASAMSS